MLDNYDLFVQHENENERRLKKSPKCSLCDEPLALSEYYFNIDGYDLQMCEDCINNCRKSTGYLEETE